MNPLICGSNDEEEEEVVVLSSDLHLEFLSIECLTLTFFELFSGVLLVDVMVTTSLPPRLLVLNTIPLDVLMSEGMIKCIISLDLTCCVWGSRLCGSRLLLFI